MIEAFRDPKCMSLKVEMHISPPQGRNTHFQALEVPLHLPESSHYDIMLNYFPSISVMH
jgi:hypothetical protein